MKKPAKAKSQIVHAMNDPRWLSNDSVHRVWVNDWPGRIEQRISQGYKPVSDNSSPVKVMVGQDLAAFLMEIPQAVYQARMSPAAGEVLSDMGSLTYRDPDYDAPIKPEGEVISGLDGYSAFDKPWSPRRWLHHTHTGLDGYIGLFNWTIGAHHWVRIVFRPHADRYLYMRLRWKPWGFWCEWRERETEVDRLNAKFPEEGRDG